MCQVPEQVLLALPRGAAGGPGRRTPGHPFLGVKHSRARESESDVRPGCPRPPTPCRGGPPGWLSPVDVSIAQAVGRALCCELLHSPPTSWAWSSPSPVSSLSAALAAQSVGRLGLRSHQGTPSSRAVGAFTARRKRRQPQVWSLARISRSERCWSRQTLPRLRSPVRRATPVVVPHPYRTRGRLVPAASSGEPPMATSTSHRAAHQARSQSRGPGFGPVRLALIPDRSKIAVADRLHDPRSAHAALAGI
jgi:hypothetical protein